MKIKKKIKEKNATFTIFSQQIINNKLIIYYYWWAKNNNFNDRFKLELMTTLYLEFVVKIF